jgi:hypothetical protein
MEDDLITIDNVSKDLLRSVFDGAYMSVRVDGDVRLSI